MILQYAHAARMPENRADLLGEAAYGIAPADASAMIRVPLPVLPAGGQAYTFWQSGIPCQEGEFEGCHYRYNAHLLFGAMRLAESDFSDHAQVGAMQQVSELAYRRVFAIMRQTGFSQLVRCWNYLPRINVDGGGLERYRQFNIGRQDAFIAARRDHMEGAPSACALGLAGGDLVLYFMAAHARPTLIENPRQVSAYRYPDRYGPRSPTFSRASLLALPDCEVLFISGTASIVGHESVHLGDVRAQTEETLRNLTAIIEQANLKSPHGGYTVRDLQMKVFVRDAAQQAEVAACIEQHLGAAPQAIYLQADICRAELLVEIEAFSIRGKHSA